MIGLWHIETYMNRTRIAIRVCAVVIGLAAAGGALALEYDPVLSENPAIALVQRAVFYFGIPGMAAAFVVSGNVHTISLRVVAVACLSFYVAVGWLVSLFFGKAKRAEPPN
jgi:hypothetical protein